MDNQAQGTSHVKLAVCFAGHLRSADTVLKALESVQTFVRDPDKQQTATVLATWDVWGMQSPESKLTNCYDTRPLGGWRCPSSVAFCDIVPFTEQQERLALRYGCSGPGARCSIRHVSQWYIIARAFALGLKFRHATLFLRMRPDTILLRPIPITEGIDTSVSTFPNHFGWPGAANDLMFFARRDGASTISRRMEDWIITFNVSDIPGWRLAVQELKPTFPSLQAHAAKFQCTEDFIPLFCAHAGLTFSILNDSTTRRGYRSIMIRAAGCNLTRGRG